METKKVTIYDIAEASGCSIATVSLALNDDCRVAEKTKKKIKKIAHNLRYQPSYFGRSLTTGKANSIKVIVPDMHNPVFVNMVDGIEQYMNQTNYHTILEVTYNDEQRELDSFSSLLDNKVDGVIISPIYEKEVSNYLLQKEINLQKIVYLGPPCSCSDKIHYYSSDSEKGAYDALKHMLENGCKRPAFLAPVTTTSQGRRRLNGYLKALQEHGIEKNEDLIVYCRNDFSEIYHKVKQLIQEHSPDGVFCLSDYAAVPVLKVAADLNICIPEDLMVIGYDNIELGEFLEKPLTTVDSHPKEQGYYAAQLLMNLLKDQECPTQNMLEPTLVIRKTTKQHNN